MSHRRAPFLLALVVLAGCLLPERSRVSIRYYSIGPTAVKAPTRAPADLSIAVRALDSASRYRDSILYRDGATAVGYHDAERWVEPPAEMVTRALRRALEAARIARLVADDRLARRADVLVEGTLTRFDEVHGAKQWTAECELELVVKHAGTGKVLAATRLAASTPADERTTKAFVTAMDHAVGDLVAQATGAVAQALAEVPKGAGGAPPPKSR